MKISRPASAGSDESSRLKSEMVCTPGIGSNERVRTTVVRLGSGLPMDSKVLRPITMTWPVVIFLNHLKSSGRCHGILLLAPMTRLRDMAAMALRCGIGGMLSHEEGAVNEALKGRLTPHCRKRLPRLAS